MNLPQWLAYLEQCHPSTIDLGLERVAEVAGRLDLDFSGKHLVTVGGTNGKGSTVAMLAAICRETGLATATYTSPHLLVYNERVNLGERLATNAELCDSFAMVEARRGDIPLTYFEFGTLAAMALFAREELDVVVFEVGLGGRLDAVNILDPEIAIVTNVALDHTDWLGDTRDAIGFEKAGIFRGGRPALVGESDIPASLLAHCRAIGAQLMRAGEDFSAAPDATGGWAWHGHDATGNARVFEGLPDNPYPLANRAVALQAASLLVPGLTREQVADGLRKAILPGRFQQLDRGYRLVLDVAHNPHAAARLAGEMAARFPARQIHILIAMLADKDYPGVIAELAVLDPAWHVSEIKEDRGLAVKMLYNQLPEPARQNAACNESISDAFRELDRRLGPDDVLLVTGSFYTVSQVLELL